MGDTSSERILKVQLHGVISVAAVDLLALQVTQEHHGCNSDVSAFWASHTNSHYCKEEKSVCD